MVQFSGFASLQLCIHCRILYKYSGFPHSDIAGSQFFCQLPNAFRRLTRPSSPIIAKASTWCTYSLDSIIWSTFDFVVGTLTILPTWVLYFDKAYCFVVPSFAFCFQRMVRYNHHPILSTMLASALNSLKSFLPLKVFLAYIAAFIVCWFRLSNLLKNLQSSLLIANKNKLLLT